MTRLTDKVQSYGPDMGIPYNNPYLNPYIQTGIYNSTWNSAGSQQPTFSDGIGPMYPQSSQKFDFYTTFFRQIYETNTDSDLRTAIEEQDYSVGAWLYINDQVAENETKIIGTAGTGGHFSFWWGRGSSNDYYFKITVAGGSTTISVDENSDAIVPGKWYYVALRRTNDGTTVTNDIFINAYKTATTTSTYDNAADISNMHFGALNYQQGSINIASFYFTTSADIDEDDIDGIFASAQPINHVVKYWDGSSWVTASDIKIYLNGEWRPIWANYWTGSEWAIL